MVTSVTLEEYWSKTPGREGGVGGWRGLRSTFGGENLYRLTQRGMGESFY